LISARQPGPGERPISPTPRWSQLFQGQSTLRGPQPCATIPGGPRAPLAQLHHQDRPRAILRGFRSRWTGLLFGNSHQLQHQGHRHQGRESPIPSKRKNSRTTGRQAASRTVRTAPAPALRKCPIRPVERWGRILPKAEGAREFQRRLPSPVKEGVTQLYGSPF